MVIFSVYVRIAVTDWNEHASEQVNRRFVWRVDTAFCSRQKQKCGILSAMCPRPNFHIWTARAVWNKCGLRRRNCVLREHCWWVVRLRVCMCKQTCLYVYAYVGTCKMHLSASYTFTTTVVCAWTENIIEANALRNWDHLRLSINRSFFLNVRCYLLLARNNGKCQYSSLYLFDQIEILPTIYLIIEWL